MAVTIESKPAGGDLEQELSPGKEEVRAELLRVTSSRLFRLAQSQRLFLEHTVGEVLAGRGHLIKEYWIGTQALGRDDSFDPRLDPIVRTQARKLRARLAQYYETEGSGNPLRIEFRKGTYAPSFCRPAAQLSPSVNESPAVLLEEAPFALDSARARGWSIPKRLVVTGVAVLAVSVLLASAVVYWRPQHPITETSIAVMPFVNLDSGGTPDFLADGLSDEIITLLQQVPEMQVAGRTSVFRLRSQMPDPRGIGKALHVQTVVIGSMRRQQGRLQLSLQLNGVDGHHIWSGTYDRSIDSTQTLAPEIVRSIVNVLGVMPPQVPAERRVEANLPSPTPGAHENYLKGLYFWNKLKADSLRTATTYFEQAIVEDPSFARAYAALAGCYAIAPQVANSPPVRVVHKIRSAATTALALDPTLGEAHIDLAMAAQMDFDWATAEKEFRKGLELSPGSVVGHLWYAKYLAVVGQTDQVLAQRRLAAQLDPVSPYAIQSVAGYYSVTKRYPEAMEQFQAALALEPGFGLAHQGLGITYLSAGQPAAAFRELQLAERYMDGPRRRALLGYAYGVAGQTARARQVLNGFLTDYRPENVPALAMAQVYTGLGDKDHAFEWLNKAVDERDLNLDLKWDSVWISLRSDHRYRAVLKRMNLD